MIFTETPDLTIAPAEKAFLIDEKDAGPNFFRGLIFASAISLLLWAAVYHAFV